MKKSAKRKSTQQAQKQPGSRESRSLKKDHTEDCARRCAERRAHADLPSAFRDRAGKDAVDAGDGEYQRYGGKGHEEEHR